MSSNKPAAPEAAAASAATPVTPAPAVPAAARYAPPDRIDTPARRVAAAAAVHYSTSATPTKE